LCVCTVSPAGAVAGVTTAPAPVGNSRPTALARSRDSRNCFSPTYPFIPQHPSTVLVVASSGQILHFTLKPLTFLRQNGRNFRVTFHSPICFVSVCVCVCVCVCMCVCRWERERCLGRTYRVFTQGLFCSLHNWYCAPDIIRVIIQIDKVGIPFFVIIYSFTWRTNV
jgi:hypothetical protein